MDGLAPFIISNCAKHSKERVDREFELFIIRNCRIFSAQTPGKCALRIPVKRFEKYTLKNLGRTEKYFIMNVKRVINKKNMRWRYAGLKKIEQRTKDREQTFWWSVMLNEDDESEEEE